MLESPKITVSSVGSQACKCPLGLDFMPEIPLLRLSSEPRVYAHLNPSVEVTIEGTSIPVGRVYALMTSVRRAAPLFQSGNMSTY